MNTNVNEEIITKVKDSILKSAKLIIISFVAGFLVASLTFGLTALKRSNTKNEEESSHTAQVTKVSENALVIDDSTIALFENAIIESSTEKKSLNVYSVDLSDAVSIEDTGLFDWKVFSKYQIITYHGTATYTVDLSKMEKRDVIFDIETNTLSIYIPHATLESINIPADKIEFSDIEKGFLTAGEVTMTAEDSAALEKTASENMEKILEETNALETADRFAKLSTYELYQPIISKIAPNVKVEIVLENN